MITGITFDFRDVLSKNDGRLYQALFGSNYIINGCDCTVANSGTAINVAEGYVAVGGRIIHFDGGETKKLTPTLTTGYGRLVVDIDLTKTATAKEFKQVTLIEQYSTTEKFQDLTQDNINLSGTHYQAELCRFTISSSAAGAITAQMPFFGGAVKKNSAEIQNLINLNGNGTRKLNVRWSSGGAGDSVYVYVTPNEGTEQQLVNISAANKYISNLRIKEPNSFTFVNSTLVTAAAGDNNNVNWDYFRAFKIPNAAIIEFSATAKTGVWKSDTTYLIFRMPTGFIPKAVYNTSLEIVQNGNNALLRNGLTIKNDGWVSVATQDKSDFTRMKGKIIIPASLLA